MDHASATGDSPPAIHSFQQRVAADLKERFPLKTSADDGHKVNVAWLASALDPRFKELWFLEEDAHQRVWSALKERAKAAVKQKTTATSGQKESQRANGELPSLPSLELQETGPPPAKRAKADESVSALQF